MVTKKLVVEKPVYVRTRRQGGHYIKAWRNHRGMSVPELSAKVGDQPSVSASMIAQLEQGRAGYTQRTLEALAKALDVMPWQLLAGNPNEDSNVWTAAFWRSQKASEVQHADNDYKKTLEIMIAHTFDAAADTAIGLAKERWPKVATGNGRSAG